ncbi:MAG: DNA-3-methyladenine glycosylase 2 family protein [Saprospiraceae bacterium]|jgi:DNA-3-methyladenine glycosylase II|nr:DNA-3-methyladenine glycosylase 2 family protein [Saprospiraceae bacterium]
MKAHSHLLKDAKLKKIIGNLPKDHVAFPEFDGQVREHLISSIVSQQLSTKVARVILDRFINFFDGTFPSSKAILNVEPILLKSVGLSLQKAQYIHNISMYFEENNRQNEDFIGLSDEQIIAELTQIKGVGKWTVEMVLIFCLGRQDVFAVDDFGIQSSIINAYKLKLEKKELKQKMLKIAEKWRPYRTLACLYLWASRDFKQ